MVSASFGFPHYQIYPGATVPKPGLESRHLYTGHHMANKQVLAMLIPGEGGTPGFDVIGLTFDASSVVHLRSSL